MDTQIRVKEFERSVKNKFNVYNSLFLSLPFQQIRNTGVLIPLLQSACQSGLEEGREPLDILDSFFASHTGITSEEDKIDFMFRVIQYVERQVVLFDSVEDAAFPALLEEDELLSLKDFIHLREGRAGGGPKANHRFDGETSSHEDDNLSTFSTRIVFTAHPTQFYPPSVLKIIRKLREYITVNNISGIDLTLQQLGLTSLIASTSPTPIDEANNILYFLRNVYYDAVGELYADIKQAVPETAFDNPDIVKLGFWPGGDRDGNPFVTSETTEEVANALRMTLMKCYYRDLKDLETKLTFRNVEQTMAGLRTAVYNTMFDAESILPFDAIIRPLIKVKALLASQYNGLYLDDVDALIDKIRIFRTHFATIDIRQHHSIHQRVVTAVLIQNGLIAHHLDELSRTELMEALLRTDLQIRSEEFTDDLVKDTMETALCVRRIQEKNGEEGCNRYVISHAEDVFSVLYVFAIYRWTWKDESIPLDIIPLFESMNGMANAASIMRELFAIPAYRAHIQSRRNRQTMMLGFSDGTKDGGYLQANWAIHKTKEALSAVCASADIEAIFFDGRGGPPSRGGGKTHRFYASQSNDIMNHAIELTIQGQVITTRYGTKEHFKHNCEQLIAAGMHKGIFENENIISNEARDLLDDLARLSYDKYTALKNHPLFIPYLENKSTLRYYSRANIGSRPQTRGTKDKLDLEDLRAIPFVGSWSQLKQNVPGYFGLGSAFKTVLDAGRIDDLKQLFRDVPFFKTLILNSMMSLSKCRFELTAYMSTDQTYGAFWRLLYEEYLLSREMLLLVSGYDQLMEEEPVSRSSIAIREEIVEPLLVIQQYALQKIEQRSERQGVYEKIVTRSLYGNINASRNSA